ncbi:MAG: signal peptidase I [Chloroflexi bacterium]|nr:signal peptidase I [Chloroflexota bacterium]
MTRPLLMVRRAVTAIWLTLIAVVLGLVALSHVALAFGYELVIVKGPSMEPAIPMGSLVVERSVAVADLEPGMIVTFVLPNNVVVTHRITRLGDANGTVLIETKGDANSAPDPAMHPAAGVTGLVHAHLPLAGLLLAFLAKPLGILSAMSLAGSLLLFLLLLEELERDRDVAGSAAADLLPQPSV